MAGCAENGFLLFAHTRFEALGRIALGGERVVIRLGMEMAVVQAQDVHAVIAGGVRFIDPAAGGLRGIA